MNIIKFIMFLVSFVQILSVTGQDLQIFDLKYYEKDQANSFVFISLSEIYRLSENFDSLAIPDLSDKELIAAQDYTYFKLDSIFRKRFLSVTNISESDKVFVYNYSSNTHHTFTIKKLNIIACLNVYGAEWPYSQEDYMIGFEIDKSFLLESDKNFSHSFAYVGKKSPFVLGQMFQIVWEKVDSNDFPIKELPMYNSTHTGECRKGDVYKFEKEGLHYFVQDLFRLKDSLTAVKHLIIIDAITKVVICEKLFYQGESASFAPLNNQWTGKLLKNKSSVIYGFQFFSFDCQNISFLSQTEKDIYVYCDNRH